MNATKGKMREPMLQYPAGVAEKMLTNSTCKCVVETGESKLVEGYETNVQIRYETQLSPFGNL